MVSFEEDIFLERDTGDLVVLNQDVLSYGFDGVLLVRSWKGSQVDLTEGSLSKLALDLEVLQVDVVWLS